MEMSSVILALQRQEQREVRGSRPARLHSKFKTSLGYIARFPPLKKPKSKSQQ